MLRRSLLAATGALAAPRVRAASPEDAVDVALVLAIDVSGSLSDERLAMQRLGHARAVTSPAFLAALGANARGQVGLAAIEWSNRDRQDLLVPWTVVEDEASAWRVAGRLLRAPSPVPGFTSISGAIDFAARLLARMPWEAARRVVDISGNGRNNDGRSAAAARDEAAAAGITVNGLPILDAEAGLDAYYAEEVIGGPDAFLVVAHDLGSFAEAIRRKLVREIAAAPGRQARGEDAADPA
ncbi:DUF1194 domain-containing protein [Falsiroseomonas sp. HW251]|uniref:DUF1194 domain-containing protein n=1 Tax=Falsiroseomonas sp. HW251 TaxID=3390998 RepID=UPI003D31CC18